MEETKLGTCTTILFPKEMRKYWNGKACGLPALICLSIKVLFRKVQRLYYKFEFLTNVNHTDWGGYFSGRISYVFPSCITIGKNTYLGKNISFYAENTNVRKLVIKDGVSINDFCELDFSGGLIIGKDSHLASHCSILTHTHGYDYKSPPVAKPIVIGEHVFIGKNSVILYNCSKIGNNAVIGSGSVVTKDVPENAVVAGNPAKIIKILS
mgnify:CR=1 FL=1